MAEAGKPETELTFGNIQMMGHSLKAAGFLEDGLADAEKEIRRGEILMDLLEKKLDFMVKNPPKKEAPAAASGQPGSQPNPSQAGAPAAPGAASAPPRPAPGPSSAPPLPPGAQAVGKAPPGAIPPPPPLSILANMGSPGKAAPALPPPLTPAPPKKPESDLELNIEAHSDPEDEAEESGEEEEAPAKPQKVFPQLSSDEIEKLRKKLKKYILEIQFGGKRKDTQERMQQAGLDPEELDLFFAQDKRND